MCDKHVTDIKLKKNQKDVTNDKNRVVYHEKTILI